MWRISVDDTCIGSGSCTGVAPAYFRLNAENRAEPVRAEVEPDEVVLDAVASCPMEAILARDTATGDVVEV